MLLCAALSSSGECLAFGGSGGYVHLWGPTADPAVNQMRQVPGVDGWVGRLGIWRVCVGGSGGRARRRKKLAGQIRGSGCSHCVLPDSPGSTVAAFGQPADTEPQSQRAS